MIVQPGQFVDAVDSHYNYVKAAIASINPDRRVQGLLTAQDWPPPSNSVILESFYLLVLGAGSVAAGADSKSVPGAIHQTQWVWIIAGNDLKSNQRGANRGDRFRINETMKNELSLSLYPGFCEKKTWHMNGTVWVGESLSPIAMVRWPSRPSFQVRADKASGVIYGTVPVSLQDWLATRE